MKPKAELLPNERRRDSFSRVYCKVKSIKYEAERKMHMTIEEQKILDRINAYAEEALADIDPQKTRISFQLEALKPVMQEIADETGKSVEDIFILYMDLASESAVEADKKLQATLEDGESADFSSIANRLS